MAPRRQKYAFLRVRPPWRVPYTNARTDRQSSKQGAIPDTKVVSRVMMGQGCFRALFGEAIIAITTPLRVGKKWVFVNVPKWVRPKWVKKVGFERLIHPLLHPPNPVSYQMNSSQNSLSGHVTHYMTRNKSSNHFSGHVFCFSGQKKLHKIKLLRITFPVM